MLKLMKFKGGMIVVSGNFITVNKTIIIISVKFSLCLRLVFLFENQ